LLFFGKKKKEETPTLYTEEACQGCGEKNRRAFEDSDYIYKSSSRCNKCSGIAMITAIYGEYPSAKEKEKEKQL
jgi:hypothetical protein